MLGKRELKRRTEAALDAMYEAQEKAELLQRKLDLIENADEKAEEGSKAEKIKLMRQAIGRKDEEIEKLNTVIDQLRAVSAARTIYTIIRYGEPDGEGGFKMVEPKLDMERYLKDYKMEITQDGDERTLRVLPL